MIYVRIIFCLLTICSFATKSCSSLSKDLVEDPTLIPRSMESLYQLSLKVLVKVLVSPEEQDSSFLEKITNEEASWHDDLKEALIKDNLIHYIKLFKDEYKPFTVDLGPHCTSENTYPIYYVFDLAFSPDGTRLACASSKNYIWELYDLPELHDPLVLEDVDSIKMSCRTVFRWSDDGSKLYAHKHTSEDELLYCWDTTTGKLLKEDELTYAQGLRSPGITNKAVLSSDGKYLIALRNGTKESEEAFGRRRILEFPMEPVLIDLKDYTCIPLNKLSKKYIGESLIHTRPKIGFSPDSRYAITAGCDSSFNLIDLSQLAEQKVTTLPILQGEVRCFLFSSDSRYLLIMLESVFPEMAETHRKGIIEIHLVHLESRTSKKVYEYGIESTCDAPRRIVFDGRYVLIATYGHYNTVLVDCINNAHIEFTSRTNSSYSIGVFTFHPNGKYAFISYLNNTLRIIPLYAHAEKKSLKELLLCLKH